ncbi:MAG: hypothetical protein E7432_03620 [Ruminococcaceae bacterium]|nr:hypothetical protein [Oscillospiraceae bacterium]
MFRPDNVSEIRWAFYVKLFKFFIASVVVLAFLILLLSNIGGALIGILMLVAYIPPAIGYVLFHTHFAIEAEKNAPPQEIPVEAEEK